MTTINEIIDRYQSEYLPGLGERTRYEYRYLLPVLRHNFGHFNAPDLKPKHVGAFLHAPGIKKKQQQNKLVALLSSIMGLAVGSWFIDGVDSNPCQFVKRHPSPPRTRYVSNSEFLAVRAMCSPSFQMCMDLALLLGQRRGDILSLTWYAVEDEFIRITQQKTGKALGIRITQAVIDVLLRARRQAPALPRWYVIRKTNGQPYSAAGFGTAWNQLMNKAVKRGVIKTRFNFHDLRAKCASDNKSLQQASALLGHSSVTLTRKVYDRNIRMVDPGQYLGQQAADYVHLSPERHEEAA